MSLDSTNHLGWANFNLISPGVIRAFWLERRVHCSTQVRLSVVQNKSVLQAILHHDSEPLEGLNDSHGQIMAIRANEGMGVAQRLIFGPCAKYNCMRPGMMHI
jgi:hypothetical protein